MDGLNEPEHLSSGSPDQPPPLRPDGLPHRGFLTLEAPAGAFAGVSAAAQRRRSRRLRLTAGLAVVVAGSLVGGAAAVSGLRTGQDQALMPLAAPPQPVASPLLSEAGSTVPAPVTSAAVVGPSPESLAPSAPSASSSSSSPSAPSTSRPPSSTAGAAPSSSSPSGSPVSGTVPPLTVPDATLGATAGCVTASGRAVDATGAPLADLVVARFVRDGDGRLVTTVAARTGNDGRFTVSLGGSLMLSPTAPGVPQPRSMRNLAPVWVGGGSFPGNPVACGSGGDTVLSPGATLVGDHTAPAGGAAETPDALTVTATDAGSPLAVAPAVATITDTGYRFVGLPVGVGAVLVDVFDHRRAFDVTAGSTREDWASCTTCIAGMPTRGGAAQVDPTAPPTPSPEPASGEPTPRPTRSAVPGPIGTPAPSGASPTTPSPAPVLPTGRDSTPAQA